MSELTEISLVGGQSIRVLGDARQVEAAILSAARGSIMALAWLTEAQSAQPVAINPDHVLTLRAASDAPGDPPQN
jgi:hypothetical protein